MPPRRPLPTASWAQLRRAGFVPASRLLAERYFKRYGLTTDELEYFEREAPELLLDCQVEFLREWRSHKIISVVPTLF